MLALIRRNGERPQQQQQPVIIAAIPIKIVYDPAHLYV
jgi:hypothetical protein